jgi:hypothetical protein
MEDVSTHGHRFVKGLLYGSFANEVRHVSRMPVLRLRGDRPVGPGQDTGAA